MDEFEKMKKAVTKTKFRADDILYTLLSVYAVKNGGGVKMKMFDGHFEERPGLGKVWVIEEVEAE